MHGRMSSMEERFVLYALVVTYNISCVDSQTCQGLSALDQENLHIIVFDNSVSDYGNRSYCQKKGWTYLGGVGNKGLSKAYNECVDYLKQMGRKGYLCLFDDDSLVNEQYFRVLAREISISPNAIYAPILYSANRIISPFLLYENHRTVLLEDMEAVSNANPEWLSAINSGMAINLALFDDYRYDEKIFLDGIDHSFILDMRCRGVKVRILPCRCEHGFSGDERCPMKAAAARFRIYVRDYSYILSDRKLDYMMLVGKRMLSLIVKYRSLRFLRIFVSGGEG